MIVAPRLSSLGCAGTCAHVSNLNALDRRNGSEEIAVFWCSTCAVEVSTSVECVRFDDLDEAEEWLLGQPDVQWAGRPSGSLRRAYLRPRLPARAQFGNHSVIAFWADTVSDLVAREAGQVLVH